MRRETRPGFTAVRIGGCAAGGAVRACGSDVHLGEVTAPINLTILNGPISTSEIGPFRFKSSTRYFQRQVEAREQGWIDEGDDVGHAILFKRQDRDTESVIDARFIPLIDRARGLPVGTHRLH
jgi:hypothetical protein